MLELPYLFPQWLYKFAPPLAINKCCLSPQPHLNELQLILIGLGHSDWYKQRPQRSFDLHSFYYSFKCFSVTGVSFFGNPLFISVPHCLLAHWFYWCLGFLFVCFLHINPLPDVQLVTIFSYSVACCLVRTIVLCCIETFRFHEIILLVVNFSACAIDVQKVFFCVNDFKIIPHFLFYQLQYS